MLIQAKSKKLRSINEARIRTHQKLKLILGILIEDRRLTPRKNKSFNLAQKSFKGTFGWGRMILGRLSLGNLTVLAFCRFRRAALDIDLKKRLVLEKNQVRVTRTQNPNR